jgi:hypothetical protein
MKSAPDTKVTVFVQDQPRSFFLGLRVRHAIGHQLSQRVACGTAVVEDGEGHRVDLDGALYDGERLYVRTR